MDFAFAGAIRKSDLTWAHYFNALVSIDAANAQLGNSGFHFTGPETSEHHRVFACLVRTMICPYRTTMGRVSPSSKSCWTIAMHYATCRKTSARFWTLAPTPDYLVWRRGCGFRMRRYMRTNRIQRCCNRSDIRPTSASFVFFPRPSVPLPVLLTSCRAKTPFMHKCHLTQRAQLNALHLRTPSQSYKASRSLLSSTAKARNARY